MNESKVNNNSNSTGDLKSKAKASDDANNENARDSEKKKPRVKGGHLRDMINYSDRF